MPRVRRPFLKQKPNLYFDENFPAGVVEYFRNPYWKPKVRVLSAAEEGYLQQSDRFHYNYCCRTRFTLVTLDSDFESDRLYPFSHGRMTGIIVIRASSSEVYPIVNMLSTLLQFLLLLPLPRAFLTETKCIAAREGVQLRGRDALTHELKTMRALPGRTTTRDVRRFFSY